MKSTSCYCFNIGLGVFSWCSKKQEIMAQTKTKAKFIVATAVANQALWLRKVLLDLNLKQEECTEVFADDQTAIPISSNPLFHGKIKHYNIKLFFLGDVRKECSVELNYCKTDLQLANIFIKVLPRSKFESLREMLGICSN